MISICGIEQEPELQGIRLIEENVEFKSVPEINSSNGKKTLVISESLLMIKDSNSCITIDYPSIIIHAITSLSSLSNSTNQQIHQVLDHQVVNEASDEVVDRVVNRVGEEDNLIYLQLGNDENEEIIEITIIPNNSTKVNQIYQIISECSELNPNPIPMDLQGEWITANNINEFEHELLNENGKRINDLLR